MNLLGSKTTSKNLMLYGSVSTLGMFLAFGLVDNAVVSIFAYILPSVMVYFYRDYTDRKNKGEFKIFFISLFFLYLAVAYGAFRYVMFKTGISEKSE